MKLYDAVCVSCGAQLKVSHTNLCAACLWDSSNICKERLYQQDPASESRCSCELPKRLLL